MVRKSILLAALLAIGLAGGSSNALASRCDVTVTVESCQGGYDFMETNFKAKGTVRDSMRALHGFCDERFKDKEQSQKACMLGGFENLLHKIKSWTQ